MSVRAENPEADDVDEKSAAGDRHHQAPLNLWRLIQPMVCLDEDQKRDSDQCCAVG